MRSDIPDGLERVLATGTPAEIVRSRDCATLEDAFISYLEEATGARTSAPAVLVPPNATGNLVRPPNQRRASFSSRRLLAYSIRETLELLRDPIGS